MNDSFKRITKTLTVACAVFGISYLVFGIPALERLTYLCLVGATILYSTVAAWQALERKAKIANLFLPVFGALLCSIRGWNPDTLMAADIGAIFFTLGIMSMAAVAVWPEKKKWFSGKLWSSQSA